MICRTHLNHKIYDDELDLVRVPKHQRPIIRDPWVNRWRFITHGCGVAALASMVTGIALTMTTDWVWGSLQAIVGGSCFFGMWLGAALMWIKYDDEELQLLSCLLYLPNGSGCSVAANISENQVKPYRQAGFRVTQY